ncbi:MAG TPA: DUF1501 domain-containing protein [Pirellulaceae bacterium]|nr:DUF1501 domain-containing protein [Pirellulaceae bacterium]
MASKLLPASGCRQFRRAAELSRREALRVGGLVGFGLTLPVLLAQRASRAADSRTTFGRAKQVISLYLHGGHPQQETFDPKPDGPSEVRGEFGAIATSVPGVQFSEVLPLTARIAHRIAVVRSMSHGNANHVSASLPAQTGHTHPPGFPDNDFPPSATDFPPFGAVIDSLRPTGQGLPSWVRIGPLMRRNNGTVLHGQLPGFLGAAHASFDVDQELLAEQVKIQAVERAAGLTAIRLSGRRDLLTEFEAGRRLIDHSPQARDLNAHYQRAFSMLTSERTAKAFDLGTEPAALRERYGQTEFGQRCLLARRLAEAGVPVVNVSYCHTPQGSWDTHSQNFKQMKESLGPTFDAAFAALVGDLADRGMLEETLVLVNAEFGRTPAINKNAGRDHWPFVYSLALAGAGIKAGEVYGASDPAAAYPSDRPHDPKDMAATIYHLLGIEASTTIDDRAGRSYPLIIGRPIEGILA